MLFYFIFFCVGAKKKADALYSTNYPKYATGSMTIEGNTVITYFTLKIAQVFVYDPVLALNCHSAQTEFWRAG